MSAKFRALLWENVTEMGSVSGAGFIILYCHFFCSSSLAISKYEKISKYELLWVHSFAISFGPFSCGFVSSSQASQFAYSKLVLICLHLKFLVPKITSLAAQFRPNKWQREKKHKFLRPFMKSHSKENGKYVMICNDIIFVNIFWWSQLNEVETSRRIKTWQSIT